MEQAYVSLTTNDQYSLGAYVLGESLRKSGTKRRLVLMVTSGVSEVFREKLRSVWDELIDVTLLESKDKENLTLLERPELACTFSKLCAWTLIQFKKCVFLDADTLVIQNVDELFDREELSAAADIGWPDCFNSGVFVFCPSMETYESLVMCAKEKGSFDGGDQGLLNEFFNWWPTRDITYRLPFTYNMVSNVCYSYAPAYRRFGKDVKIVHFLGSIKPWHHSYDASTGKVTPAGGSRYCGPDERFIQMWWDCCVAKEASSKAGNSVEAPHVIQHEHALSLGGHRQELVSHTAPSAHESLPLHAREHINTRSEVFERFDVVASESSSGSVIDTTQPGDGLATVWMSKASVVCGNETQRFGLSASYTEGSSTIEYSPQSADAGMAERHTISDSNSWSLNRSRNSAAPNFTDSLDFNAHLMKTVKSLKLAGRRKVSPLGGGGVFNVRKEAAVPASRDPVVSDFEQHLQKLLELLDKLSPLKDGESDALSTFGSVDAEARSRAESTQSSLGDFISATAGFSSSADESTDKAKPVSSAGDAVASAAPSGSERTSDLGGPDKAVPLPGLSHSRTEDIRASQSVSGTPRFAYDSSLLCRDGTSVVNADVKEHRRQKGRAARFPSTTASQVYWSHKAYASETRASAGDEARGFEGREVRSSRESWERGTVDYSGEDSFANILAHISGLMIGTERATNQAPGRLADPAPGRLADPAPERLADPAPERLADPAPDQMPK